ncbi:hypothetical protein [Ideonella livida]|uniref:Alpha/beta hydrolase n=1 Tax=Ideonella livida TaxID=2707176 RepID=A0A7C9TMU8_9BURK|nr:hypothetical protein [Ideonella livida]NDY92667.1 hypothetical protein [Ideonella livida]
MSAAFRHVYFIGGFDPKSAAHYHRLYRQAVQGRTASPAGETVTVGTQRQQIGHLHRWEVAWQAPGQASCRTRYGVFSWHDVVQAHWPGPLGRALRDYLQVYGRAGTDGTFARVRRAAPAAFWLAVFPFGVACAALGAGAGLGAWAATASGAASASLGALAGLATALLPWRGLVRLLDAEWLLRLYGFTFAQARGRLPDLEARLDAFARELVADAEQAREAGVRELLVVAHSTGAILATDMLDRALRLAPWLGREGPQLGLLTLAHCTPILAYQPAAGAYRAALDRLAAHPGLHWLDVSAPSDWAAFARVTPWGGPATPRLQQRSPRFHQAMDAAQYQRLLRRRHELHMQYLKSTPRVGFYDAVALTAGPDTLATQMARPWTATASGDARPSPHPAPDSSAPA